MGFTFKRDSIFMNCTWGPLWVCRSVYVHTCASINQASHAATEQADGEQRHSVIDGITRIILKGLPACELKNFQQTEDKRKRCVQSLP